MSVPLKIASRIDHRPNEVVTVLSKFEFSTNFKKYEPCPLKFPNIRRVPKITGFPHSNHWQFGPFSVHAHIKQFHRTIQAFVRKIECKYCLLLKFWSQAGWFRFTNAVWCFVQSRHDARLSIGELGRGRKRPKAGKGQKGALSGQERKGLDGVMSFRG